MCVCKTQNHTDSFHTAFIASDKNLFKPIKGLFSHYKVGLFEGLGFYATERFQKLFEKKNVQHDQREHRSVISESQAALNTMPSKVIPILPQRLQTASPSY